MHAFKLVAVVLASLALMLVLARLAVPLLDRRAGSLRSEFAREAARLPPSPAGGLIEEKDLAPFPPLVQTWLRRAGAVGQPHVRGFHVRFRGQLRNGLDAPWMDVAVEQRSTISPAVRLFFVEASLKGVPFTALHVYAGPHATMRVQVASLLQVVDARGPEMDQSETVTLFNDLCLLAPAALVDVPVRWDPHEERSVRATFTNAGHTVSAVLSFDAQGDLADFVSLDRSMSADGKTYERLPWATPVRDYQQYGQARLARTGEAIWQLASGQPFPYARFTLESVEYDTGAAR